MRRFIAVFILSVLTVSAAKAEGDLAALVRQTRDLEERGQTDAAVKMFAQAVDRATATAGPDSAVVGDILDRYVSMLLRTGRYADCVPLAERLANLRMVQARGDAVQAAGRIPVHFHDLGVTTMAISAHKFHGPKGIGALLLRRNTKLLPRLFGGHQQQGRRPGTEPVALAVGMAAALNLWRREAQARRSP